MVASLRIHCGCTWLRGQGLSRDTHQIQLFPRFKSLPTKSSSGGISPERISFLREKNQNALTGGERCIDFPKIIASKAALLKSRIIFLRCFAFFAPSVEKEGESVMHDKYECVCATSFTFISIHNDSLQLNGLRAGALR